MRILFITCHLPYPPHSGGRLREHELLARLTERFEVHIAAVSKTLAYDEAAVAGIPWDHDGVSLFAAAQLAGIAGVAPQVARHRSETATAGVRELLARGRFDVVHVEGFYVWQHLGPTRLPTVLVEQNIEWQLFEQRGLLEEAAATRRAELAVWRQAALLGALTPDDRAVMEQRTGRPAHLIPDGADHLPAPRARRARDGGTLSMVANFGYAPNVDGALWLANEVMPRVREVVPDARLRLVGASPPREIRGLAGEAIEVTGRVPDVGPYLAEADVVVCPLRFGGGVKVKMLEALACGKAIVSTDIGCQGLGAARGAVHVAGSAEAFAGACAELLENPAARVRAERAAAAVPLPSWDDAAEALADCWQLVARRALAAA